MIIRSATLTLALSTCIVNAQTPSPTVDPLATDAPTSNPTLNPGTSQWYVSYPTTGNCHKDCPTIEAGGSDPDCGGVVTSSEETFVTVTSCCMAKLSYIQLAYCEGTSQNQNETSPYLGSGKYYAGSDKCLEDCEEGEVSISGEGICGGIVKEASVQLFDSVEVCCDQKLGYLGAVCVVNSESNSTGSELYFADEAEGYCVKDLEPDLCPETETCVRATASNKLYPDLSTCCSSALAYVNTDYCEAMGFYTEKWVVDYPNEVCKKECNTTEDALGICVEDIKEVADTTTMLYETAEECCAEKLSTVQYCAETSQGIAATGTSKWYVSYEDKQCNQDCPVDDGLATPAPTPAGTPDPLATPAPTVDPLAAGDNSTYDPCGGLATPDMTLYDSETICCESTLAYLSLPFCESMSLEGIFNGTNLFYPDSESNRCVEDCEVGGNATNGGICGGIVEESWMQLYDDAAACCAEKLSSLGKHCVVLSEPNSTGSELFFADETEGYCVKDLEPDNCTDTEVCRRAELNDKLYPDVATCCSSALAYVNTDYCEAMGFYTEKWVVDYPNEVCKKECNTTEDALGICVEDIKEVADTTTTLYETAAECCSEKLGYVQYCAEYSQGMDPTGSSKWYVSYEDKQCNQDCPVDDGLATPAPTPAGTPDPLATPAPTVDPLAAGDNSTYDPCGGLATPDMALYDSETICCESTLAYLSLPFCESMSLEGVFNGTGKFYVDYGNNKCSEDCEGENATSGGICGGIIEDASVKLFDDAETCCAEKLSYIELEYCMANTLTAINATEQYFSVTEGHCVKDSANCTDPDICGLATSNDKLYEDISACCEQALPWVTTELCETRSLNATYTDLWFVDYTGEMCKQDCDPVAPPCGTPPDLTTKLYDLPESCCAEKLGYVDQNECKIVSEGGSPESYLGTSKWYASTQTCAQDCEDAAGAGTLDPLATPSPSPDPLATPAPAPSSEFCGGIVDAKYTPLFDDTAACCEAKLAYIDVDLCEAMSTASHSEKFYVDYSNEVCSQDCNGTALPCAGYPEDVSTQMFDSLDACCAEKLSWVNTCVFDSMGVDPIGSGKYYIDWKRMKCVTDCIESDGPPCGGIVPHWLDETQLYTNAATCCSTHLSDVPLEECVFEGGETLDPLASPSPSPDTLEATQ